MNMVCPYRLAPGVALRPEAFGALVYRYDDRRLYVIHSLEAATFVSGLDGVRRMDDAIAEFVSRNGLSQAARDALLRTIEQLERKGVIASVDAT